MSPSILGNLTKTEYLSQVLTVSPRWLNQVIVGKRLPITIFRVGMTEATAAPVN